MICYCCFRLSLIYTPHVCSMYILIFRNLAERSSLCYHYQSLGFCTWKSGNVIFGIPEPVPFNYLSVQLFSYMHIFQKEHQWLAQSQYTNGSSCMFSSVWSLNHIGGSEIEVLASWSVIYSCLECLDPPPSSQLSKRLALYIWLQTLWRHLMQIFLKSWNLIESFVKATHASC